MLTITEISFIFLAIVSVLILVRNQQAKEEANHAAKRFCEQNALQFLDGTVSMRRLWLTRPFPSLAREFRFEYSTDKISRYTGNISIVGQTTLSIHVDPAHLPG